MKPMKKSTNHRLAQAVALTLAASAVSQGYALTFVTDTLSIAATGGADLQDNNLIVSTTDFATVNGYVATGFNAGAWNGYGINSSIAALAALPTAIGVVNNADLGIATFFGVTVSATASLARFTYYGDANLDGLVDSTDYAFTDAGFFGGGNNWLLGDYDYSSVVDETDYAFQDAGFFGQGAPLAPSLVDSGPKLSGSVVPEPTSLALLALSALALCVKRSRN